MHHFVNLFLNCLVICPYKLMHCARYVLSCLPPPFLDEKRDYLYVSAFLWDSKQVRSLPNLVECKVTLPYWSSSGLFISIS